MSRAIGAVCFLGIGVGLAVFMIMDTRSTFPGESFTQLFPGYVLFPSLVMLFAIFGAALVMSWE